MDIFIGYDPREEHLFQVCRYSLVRRASQPLEIRPLGMPPGLYSRTWHEGPGGQRIDDADGRPFSTDFSFSRFLVPALMDYSGWALFCDCDFLFLADVAELFALRDASRAVQCVQHRHRPRHTQKKEGVAQTRYPRKNWSSLVLWNCGHPAHRALTPAEVNSRPGGWLHGFGWLEDGLIGGLPEAWNWLSGWSPETTAPKAVHYTEGGPWLAKYRGVPYADAWLSERARMEQDPGPTSATDAAAPRPPGPTDPQPG
jgi:hypothetical protein